MYRSLIVNYFVYRLCILVDRCVPFILRYSRSTYLVPRAAGVPFILRYSRSTCLVPRAAVPWPKAARGTRLPCAERARRSARTRRTSHRSDDARGEDGPPHRHRARRGGDARSACAGPSKPRLRAWRLRVPSALGARALRAIRATKATRSGRRRRFRAAEVLRAAAAAARARCPRTAGLKKPARSAS